MNARVLTKNCIYRTPIVVIVDDLQWLDDIVGITVKL